MKEKRYYNYQVYGLIIQSEIEIPEFVVNDQIPDCEESIKICYGEMKEEIKQHIQNGKKTYMTNQDIWFSIENIATYHITDGNLVVVEPCENCDTQLMKLFLMCSCMGFIMIQRNKVAIHGGTVVMGDKAVIITGDRGAGKSTLTTALRQKGYKFLADDVAATLIEEVPKIQCGFPYQKLCEDAMDAMGYDKGRYTSFEGDGKVKYIIPAFNDFEEEDKPLEAICEIVAGDVQQVEIEVIKGQEKLRYILKNLYRGEFLSALGGMHAAYFKQCLDIAKHVAFYKVTRPRQGFTVEEQIKCIEEKVS